MFVWTFVRANATARRIARNERALAPMRKKDIARKSDVREFLGEAQELRQEGQRAGQSDFTVLHARQVSLFDEAVTESISSIDTIKSFMFIFAVFLAFGAIVKGVGVAELPKTADELRPFAFNLLKALALAYVPSTACMGSFLILHALGSMLHVHAQRLRVKFDKAAYRVAIFGRPADEVLQGGMRVSS
jgi:hypothetical protein